MSYKTQRGNAAKKSLRFHAMIKKISDYQQVTYHPRGRVPPRRTSGDAYQTNLLLLIRGEELVLEEDEVEGSDGDTAVREIEDRFEEAERMAADEREPGRPGHLSAHARKSRTHCPFRH